MALRLDTGVPWVDVDDDFHRARRQHELARVDSWLRREPDGASLLQFDEVVRVLGFRGEYYLGVRTIRLDTVVGTVEEARDFDRRFRPTSDRDRQRWEQLDLAERRGAAIPPIEVYRVGALHFVKDGHHRVSVAMATGQVMIDADVTEVLTRLPATGISRRSDLMAADRAAVAADAAHAASPMTGGGVLAGPVRRAGPQAGPGPGRGDPAPRRQAAHCFQLVERRRVQAALPMGAPELDRHWLAAQQYLTWQP